MASELDNSSGDGAKEKIPEESVDEKKIETAVKFLQNPNVRKTSFDNRISFLKKKGLSSKEIEIAVSRSNTAEDKNVDYSKIQPQTFQGNHVADIGSPVPVVQPTSNSFASQLSSVLIGGGIIYAAAYIIKAYVVPYFVEKVDHDIESLEQNVKQLSKGVNELSSMMKDTLTSLEEKLENQQTTLTEVNAELAIAKRRLDLIPSDVTSLSDVKAEIGSVKSLLLSRNQFPASPFAPSTTSPSIPAWQKVTTRKRAEDAKAQQEKLTDTNKETTKDANSTEGSPSQPPSQGTSTAETDESHLLPDDSFDQEVAEITENNSNSFSSTYIKVDGES